MLYFVFVISPSFVFLLREAHTHTHKMSGASDVGSNKTNNSSDAMNYRLVAKSWANDVVKRLQVSQSDRPFVQAVLVEAAMFEVPIQNLAISLNPVGDSYNICIKGYEELIDTVRWNNTFLGVHRNDMIQPVTHTFVHLKDQAMVVQANMMKYHHASDATDAAAAVGAALEVTDDRTSYFGQRKGVGGRQYGKRIE